MTLSPSSDIAARANGRLTGPVISKSAAALPWEATGARTGVVAFVSVAARPSTASVLGARTCPAAPGRCAAPRMGATTLRIIITHNNTLLLRLRQQQLTTRRVSALFTAPFPRMLRHVVPAMAQAAAHQHHYQQYQQQHAGRNLPPAGATWCATFGQRPRSHVVHCNHCLFLVRRDSLRDVTRNVSDHASRCLARC